VPPPAVVVVTGTLTGALVVAALSWFSVSPGSPEGTSSTRKSIPRTRAIPMRMPPMM